MVCTVLFFAFTVANESIGNKKIYAHFVISSDFGNIYEEGGNGTTTGNFSTTGSSSTTGSGTLVKYFLLMKCKAQ